jgi:hypothetical protein
MEHIMLKKLLPLVAIAALFTGCASTETKTSESAPALNNDEFYEVHHDGRINIFYDAAVYKEFLQLGETSYRMTQIGAGPKGETIVYGLTKADKKMKNPIPSIEMVEGRMDGATEDFYAEIRTEGRIYVFNDWSEVEGFRQVGEAPYRFTQIGAGPEGETVVFVLTKANKKQEPTALMKKFDEFYKS